MRECRTEGVQGLHGVVKWFRQYILEGCRVNFTLIEDLVNQLNRAASPTPGELAATTRLIVERLCQAFSADSPEGREKVAGLSRAARESLLRYVWVAAEDAVRRNSPHLVLEGLTALAIEDGALDIRDSIVSLALLLQRSVAQLRSF
jgi:hypothetical protein